jgi:hypothetical protein
MKEQILELRKQGKSYREIQKEVKCSKSLISYYVNPTGKIKNIERQNKNRYRRRIFYKGLRGSKCEKCGYDKCLDALQFHHIDPKKKLFEIKEGIWECRPDEEIKKEISKCLLLCANCHYEVHSRSPLKRATNNADGGRVDHKSGASWR